MKKMTTVAIATLGCKVNQYESEALLTSLEKKGYLLVPFGRKADITIINTCTVTHRADFQSRQMMRRASRSNPGSLLIVTGCYAEVGAQGLEKMEGVKYLIGNREKAGLADLLPLMERGELPKVQVSGIQEETVFADASVPSFHHHTRAFLKIQDGCDARCSYCIVPFARGPSRSLAPERVLEHVGKLKDKGFKEVVLTGIHVGAYGLDLVPKVPLEDLLRRMEMEETPRRIRLSSIEPGDFSPGLISLLSKSSKICPHLHIPIQSGDDEVLKRMNRDYDSSFLSGLIQELDRAIPNLSMGADLIAGFPGETEKQFEKTCRLMDSLPVSYFHVFPYSRRKGTPAAQFPERVADGVIKRRAERLRILGREKRHAFYGRFFHQELEVLGEDRRDKKTGAWKGLSRNYIPVLLSSGKDSIEPSAWVNEEWSVLVTKLADQGVIGELVGR